MAAPHATAFIALMMQAGVEMKYETIVQSVIDIKDPGYDKRSGFGILNPHISIDKIGTPPADPPEDPPEEPPVDPPDNTLAIKEQLSNINASNKYVQEAISGVIVSLDTINKLSVNARKQLDNIDKYVNKTIELL